MAVKLARSCVVVAMGWLVVVSVGNGGKPQAVAGGDDFKPGKLPEEVVAKLQPGLTLRFFSGGGTSPSLDARRVRLAALHVPDGSPPSVVLPAGPFHATLRGLLREKLNAELKFKLAGTGNAVLQINNKEVAAIKDGAAKESAVVELVQGYNKIEVRYASPAKGDATVRLYWSGEEFGWEPVPPDQLFSSSDDADLASGLNLREGRLLFATLGCAHCHGLPGKLAMDRCPMPELQHRAPSLANAGHRFGAAWLARWIADPHALRPEATMPRLLHGPAVPQEAADLAAYVASLKVGDPMPSSKVEGELTEAGEKLYVNLGCIACHHLKEPSEKDDYNRLSLYSVGSKFAPGALETFLRAPQRDYPWSRMPDFKLAATDTVDEAAALTSYLLSEIKAKVENAKSPVGDAKRGAELFAGVGCAQCHVTTDKEILPGPNQAFPNPKLLAKGCLADDAASRGKAPQFELTAPQRSSLRAFLATDGDSLTRETLGEFSLRQMKLLQCSSCHSRDSAVSRWYNVMTGEFGRDPEYLPQLTWTGEKLHPEWTEKLLAGKHDHRARPWLKARMPAFPARAALLAPGLSHEHGFALKEDPRPAPDSKLAAMGEKLIPQAGGFNCVQCHSRGSEKAVEPFDSEGINLLDAALRLRYEYFCRWMIDPSRVDRTAKMPKFTEEGGKKTKIANILDGDARQQFDAIWQFIQTLPGKDQ